MKKPNNKENGTKSDISTIYDLRNELPDNVLEKAHFFMRELGEAGLFTVYDLIGKARIENERYAVRIVKFCLDKKIIAPAFLKCPDPFCGFDENPLEEKSCGECGASLTGNDIFEQVFEIIGLVPKTETKEKRSGSMKLAEALLERKNVKQRIDALAQRLIEDAKVQEGDKPAGNPMETLREIGQLINVYRELIVRINKTNAESVMPDGRTIMESIAERDVLSLKYGILNRLASAAVVSRDRYSRNEIKFVPTVDVAEIRKMTDQVAKEMRELDAKIQAANWTVELL